MGNIQSQKEAIRAYLLQGNSITPLEALRDFGCYRLASRISDLRREGLPVQKTTETGRSKITGKLVRFSRYFIPKENL